MSSDVRHTVTQEDLDHNPSLVEAGTQVGDVLELTNEEHDALVTASAGEEVAADAGEEVAADAGTEEVAEDAAGTEEVAADAAGTEVAAGEEVAADAGAEVAGDAAEGATA